MRESSEAFLFAPHRARSGTSIAVVEAHHTAIQSLSHSSMKAENWFQLRVLGVTEQARSSDRAFFGSSDRQAVSLAIARR